MHQALLFRQLSEDVTLFLHDALRPGPRRQAEQLAARGVAVVAGRGRRGRGRRTTGSPAYGWPTARSSRAQALVVRAALHRPLAVLASLGARGRRRRRRRRRARHRRRGRPDGATSVPGVWVAGNVTDLSAQVVVSAAAGMRAGAMINADLAAEDTARAVEARRPVS